MGRRSGCALDEAGAGWLLHAAMIEAASAAAATEIRWVVVDMR
jgi:hypothetical protein